MSRQSEERNRERFAEKMREKSVAAKNAKQVAKKTPGQPTPLGSVEGSPEGHKKD
jgi:hypothetical protein